MNIKQIIAREFLVLIFTCVLCALTLPITYFLNAYYSNKAEALEELQSKKEALSDSLEKPFNKKLRIQSWFYEKVEDYGFTDLPPSDILLWEDALTNKDSIEIKWHTNPDYKMNVIPFCKSINIKGPKQYYAFIVNNTVTHKDSLDKKRSEAINDTVLGMINEKYKYYASSMSYEQREQFTYNSFFVLIALLFGLRYLYYAIRWSIRTLNTTKQ
jgi:hypothetical protein